MVDSEKSIVVTSLKLKGTVLKVDVGDRVDVVAKVVDAEVVDAEVVDAEVVVAEVVVAEVVVVISAKVVPFSLTSPSVVVVSVKSKIVFHFFHN